MILPATLGRSDQRLKILCLGAHCDDVEIGCGGTLLRLIRERPGTRVRWVIFSANPEREAELRSCGKELLSGADAQIEVFDFRESFFPYAGAAIKEQFEKVKKAENPDLIFTHRAQDLHQDHRTVGELTWNTFRDHLIFEYEIPKYEGDLGHPQVFVPLSADLALRKAELIAAHYKSQATRTWFSKANFEASMRMRGIECNAAEGFAEAFHVRKLVL